MGSGGTGASVVGATLLLACQTGGVSVREGTGDQVAVTPFFDNARVPGVELGEDTVKSGSRLRARVWVSEEGLRVPTTTFHDTELGSDCVFRRAEDGKWRCLPGAPMESWSGFVDAECTRPSVVDRLFQSPQDFALIGTQQCQWGVGLGMLRAQERPYAVYRLGPSHEGLTYNDLSGDCRADELPEGYLFERTYERGTRLVPGRFVAASEAVGAESGPLAYHQLVAEDGAALAVAWHDLDADADCAPWGRERTDVPRCIPGPVGYAFPAVPLESSCSNFLVVDEQCVAPRAVSSAGAVHAVARADAVELSDQDQICYDEWFATYHADSWELYAVGAELNVSDFAEITHAERTVGRLTVAFDTAANGALPLPVTWNTPSDVTDSRYGHCELARGTDGDVRCVPGHWTLGLYADAACGERIAIRDSAPAVVTDTTVSSDVYAPGQFVQGTDRLPVVEVYEVGAPHEGPLYGLNLQGECVAVPESELEARSLTGFFALGAQIPPDNFVRFEFETVEP